MLLLQTMLVGSTAIAGNGGQTGGRGGSDSGGRADGGEKGSGRGNSGSRGDAGDNNNRGADAMDKGSASSRSKAGAEPGKISGDTPTASRDAVSVKHENGIAEEINGRGRYVMRDAQGRTIVNRPATGADIDRLNALNQ